MIRPRITHVLFGGLGGHGSVVFSLVRASGAEAEHRLIFVGTDDDLLPAYAEECSRLGVAYSYHRTAGGFDWRFHYSVMRALLDWPADIALVHSTGSLPTALLARLSRGTRVVVVEHQAWNLRSRRYSWATMLGLMAANDTVVLTDTFKKSLLASHPVLARRARVSVVPNGIDVNRFSATKMVESSVVRNRGVPRIGMQARLISIKDHESLIRAVPLIERQLGHSVTLELAGDGDHRFYLESLVAELGIHRSVHFLGTLAEHQVVTFLQGLDVYVHASLGEGMSTALLQAMATARPIVASDVRGISELVRGHNVAVLVSAQDPAGYADAVVRLLHDPERCAQLGLSARRFVESKFASEAMWQGYRVVLGLCRGDQQGRTPVTELLGLTVPLDDPSPKKHFASARVSASRRDYCFWPSTEKSRIVWAGTDDNVGRWFQRTGILGGGRTPTLRWAARQGFTWPIVRKRAALSAADSFLSVPVPPLAKVISDHLSRVLPSVPGNAELRFGFNARSVVRPHRGVICVFLGEADSPVAIIKVSLDPAGHHLIGEEHRILGQLRIDASEDLAARLPRPLGYREHGTTALAMFSYVDGTLLPRQPTAGRRLGSLAVGRYLHAVEQISKDLRAVGKGDKLSGEALAEMIDRFVVDSDICPDSRRRFESFRQAVRNCSFDEHLCWQHGDLAHGNLLLHWGSARAVDWELARPSYPPWFDVCYAALMTIAEPVTVTSMHELRSLEGWLDQHWSYDIPMGWALTLTAMQSAVRSKQMGRSGRERWEQLAIALLAARDGRARSGGMVPEW